jgi:hypothetical protein
MSWLATGPVEFVFGTATVSAEQLPVYATVTDNLRLLSGGNAAADAHTNAHTRCGQNGCSCTHMTHTGMPIMQGACPGGAQPQAPCSQNFGCPQQSQCQCTTLTSGSVGCCPTSFAAQPTATMAPMVYQQSKCIVRTYVRMYRHRCLLIGCGASVQLPATVHLSTVQCSMSAADQRRQWMLSTDAHATTSAATTDHCNSARCVRLLCD